MRTNPAGKGAEKIHPAKTPLSFLLIAGLFIQIAAPMRAADFSEARENIPQNSDIGHSLSGPNLSFSLTPQEMLENYQEAETQYQAALKKVLALPQDRINFENTAQALETAASDYSDKIQPLIFLSQVSPNPQIRETANQIEEKYLNFWSQMEYKALHNVLRQCADKKEELDQKDRKLLKNSPNDFESNRIETTNQSLV